MMCEERPLRYCIVFVWVSLACTSVVCGYSAVMSIPLDPPCVLYVGTVRLSACLERVRVHHSIHITNASAPASPPRAPRTAPPSSHPFVCQ
eukprot:7301292-Pyramimonas_sp.AAC.1